MRIRHHIKNILSKLQLSFFNSIINELVNKKTNLFIFYFDQGFLYQSKNNFDQAMWHYNKAIALKPDYHQAYLNLAKINFSAKKYHDALEILSFLRKENGNAVDYSGEILKNKMQICDWTDFESHLKNLMNQIYLKKISIDPFSILAMIDDPLAHKLVAEDHSKKIDQDLPNSSFRYYKHKKIRIGYFSADFHNHATMHLMADLFENHNKSKFELHAFSLGPNLEDEWRKRIRKNFNSFNEVSQKNDLEIIDICKELELDIAIDLNGYTLNQRLKIFSLRPAAIQINYLGFPGTLGAKFIDYIIADKVIISEDKKNLYTEHVVYMPHCYQANISKKSISEASFTKKDFGLSESQFVFCCFNQNYKITPFIFDAWSNILRSVPDSVLWILNTNDYAIKNIHFEAERRGIDKKRIIFAEKLPLDEHLKRIQLANLFLDTYPYGAHTSASDALRVGLPVVTLQGKSFASRVCSSLLLNLNLPELVANNIDKYIAIACRLATHQQDYEALRVKLKESIKNLPVFDAANFTLDFEKNLLDIYHEKSVTKY